MMEFAAKRTENPSNALILNSNTASNDIKTPKSRDKIILFLKNEPEKLLKTKDEPEKRTGNEAKTNQAILLKINDGLKNEPKTNRKTKRAILLKIKGHEKTNRKQSEEGSSSSALQKLGYIATPTCRDSQHKFARRSAPEFESSMAVSPPELQRPICSGPLPMG